MSDAPPKFITVDGRRSISPEWKKWKHEQNAGGAASSSPAGAGAAVALPHMKNEATALPVVCNRQDVAGTDIQMSDAVAATEAKITANEAQAAAMGMDGAALMEGLYAKMAVYEVPAALVQSLLKLSEYTVLNHIVDDSGSMGCNTDVKDKNGKWLTRWQEAKERLLTMIDVASWIPGLPSWHITFLNRSTVLKLERVHGQTPAQFFEASKKIIADEFDGRGPSGSTPFLERIEEALCKFPSSQPVAHWWWSDGSPNGGQRAIDRINEIVMHRADPMQHPITLMSCTDQDGCVQWLKDLESVATFTGECDDYGDESDEVLSAQGRLFPFSYGMYICSCLVGAMCPTTLDALDEPTPFVKGIFDDCILGYKTTEADYFAYFDAMLDAQRRKPIAHDRLAKLSRDYIDIWSRHRAEFVTAKVPTDIPVVQEFHRKSRAIVSGERQASMRQSREPVQSSSLSMPQHLQQQDDCCCVVA